MAQPSRENPPESAPAARRKPMPRWKKILLTVAVFSALVGAGFQLFGMLRSEPPKTTGVSSDQGNVPGGMGNSFLPGAQPPAAPSPEGAQAEGSGTDWSPLLLKGGLSFLVGFSVGYALRTFARISAVVLGLVFLSILGLQYAGMIQVNWESMQDAFNTIAAKLKDELGGFQTFVTGSLPSAAMGGAGLLTGFKKS